MNFSKIGFASKHNTVLQALNNNRNFCFYFAQIGNRIFGKYTKEGDIVLVPGKVLSMGELNKNVTVAGWRFSKSAEEKINRKGKAITIQELMKQNPEGKKVRIIG